MKQILQSLKTGEIEIAEIPCPNVKPGHLLIKTNVSLISAGTERMLLEFGQAGWIDKIRQQPDKVKMVLEKIKTDGLLATLDAVKSKLEQPISLGYCNVGEVIETGAGVTEFQIGDRVLSNGAHAEIVCVPKNLCVKVPENVEDEEAVFGVCGAIALEGIRLAKPELGECVAVFGLGLIGLLLVQLLRAQGCRVLGVDFDKEKLSLAKQFGADTVDLSIGEDPISKARSFSRGRDVDAVLIAASSHSHDIVHQAAEISRKRGRIVLVGVVGLQLSREDFYKKELTFQVSCSYGPGRYDVNYEERGQDYPLGFVRWTEQRNFEAVLDMMKLNRIDVKPLISHQYDLMLAEKAYQLLSDKQQSSLGIVIRYSQKIESEELLKKKVILTQSEKSSSKSETVHLGVIGAGNYASRVLIPAFKQASARLITIASSGGLTAAQTGKKLGFEEATTDIDALIHDDRINTVVIATRHDSHADLVCRALNAGKKVFVEKPLAINQEQLDQIVETYNSLLEQGKTPFLMVGFNRRFAPHIQKMKELLDTVSEPKVFIYTVNAGYIPQDHWTQDLNVGGGRIIGEACHMIDLLRFLTGASIVDVKTTMLNQVPGKTPIPDDVTMTLTFADGSVGTIHYLANGHKSFSKEQIEVFCAGKILQLDNFRKMKGYGWPKFKRMNLWRQDKGQRACVQTVVQAVEKGSDSPIAFEELVEVSEISVNIG